MKYCLDTNILIYIVNGNNKIKEKFFAANPSDLVITFMNKAELYYGAYKSQRLSKNIKILNEFLSPFEVLYPNSKSTDIFARVWAELEKEGKKVDTNDLLIASICLANNITLVTNNTKHFDRINGLRLENWVS